MGQVRISHYDSTHPINLMDALMHDGYIKGHAKLVLTNEKTGKVEQIEQDNVVTDAVKNIFRYNYSMAANLPNLSLKKLFGGVLLFRDIVAEPSADMVYPWSESNNPMTACAGDQGHNTRNPYRGNPNALASSISADGRTITQVWEWNTSQGNGTIGSLSLTSAACGNMGLKPYDFEYPWLNFSCNNADKGFTWKTDNVPNQNMFYPWWSDSEHDQRPQVVVSAAEGEYGLCIMLDEVVGQHGTFRFRERKVEHPFLKLGYEAAQNEWVFRSERYVEFTDPDYPSCNGDVKAMWVQVTDDYYYVIAMDADSDEYKYNKSTNDMWVIKIARASMTVSSSNIYHFKPSYSNDEIPFLKSYPFMAWTGAGYAKFLPVNVNPFYLDENGWLYATAKEENGLVITCNTARFKIDGDGVGTYQYQGTTTRTKASVAPTVNYNTDMPQTSRYQIGKGIVGQVDTDRCGFYNGDMWYDTAYPTIPNGSYSGGTVRHIGVLPVTPFSYPAMAYSTIYQGTNERPHETGFCHSNLYLATVNSLQETVEKTSVMGMRVEYTLSVLS